jgi:6-pyruvoyltetrahydropterin/6-carboxytetrahydropterin synthase
MTSKTLTLRRSVRACFSAKPDARDRDRTGKNGYAGFPRMHALGAFAQFDVSVDGAVNSATGYLLDIHTIDKALHAALASADIAGAYARSADPLTSARALFAALQTHLPSASALRWHLTPFTSIEMRMPNAATLRARFDFAAAHRLHASALSNEANRATFGKCNNPNAHGHNYQFEPAVRIDVPAAHGFSLLDLEQLCETVLLNKFDHTNLNLDTQEFNQAAGGLNPSVENIALVFFNLLAPAIAAKGATLEAMTVWETDRTYATVHA